MGGGKGGSQTTEIKLPPELEALAIKNLEEADAAADIGYIPYAGNTLAALTPAQHAAWQGQAGLMDAFGLGGTQAYNRTIGQLPQATTDEGGAYGYNPLAQYMAALDAIPAGQRDAIEAFSIDPLTGEARQRAETGYGGSEDYALVGDFVADGGGGSDQPVPKYEYDDDQSISMNRIKEIEYNRKHGLA
jgi:hypothetical protein